MKAVSLLVAAALSAIGFSAATAKPINHRTAFVPMPPEKPLMLADNLTAASAVGAPQVIFVSGINDEDRAYAKKYITDRKYQNLEDDHHYSVGDEAPERGTYYRIEGRPSFEGYRYAELNGHLVLVDARTRRVVEILN